MCEQPSCKEFEASTRNLRLDGASSWLEEMRKNDAKYECGLCVKERARRARVLPMKEEDDVSHLYGTLSSARFKDSIYITRCNEPVGTYALDRARLFAQTTQAQLLWTQAEDYLDDPHFSELSEGEKGDARRHGFLLVFIRERPEEFLPCYLSATIYH